MGTGEGVGGWVLGEGEYRTVVCLTAVSMCVEEGMELM